MRRIVYNISEIEPYINWLYFYHAWGLSGKPREEKDKMKAEALDMLHSWEGEPYPAVSSSEWPLPALW